MSQMENWKLTLAWGCLVIFFAFPIASLFIHLMRFAESHSFAQDFRYIGEYLRIVAAIIISLAGFNTVEIFRSRKES